MKVNQLISFLCHFQLLSSTSTGAKFTSLTHQASAFSSPLQSATASSTTTRFKRTAFLSLKNQAATKKSTTVINTTSQLFSNMSDDNNQPTRINFNNIKVSISDAFDGGNGKFLKEEIIDGQQTVFVNIKKDPFTQLEQCHHFQYFSFRSTTNTTNTTPATIKYVLHNAGKASYSIAWKNSTTFVSTTPSDPFSWKRILDTSYNETNGQLSWTYEHDSSSVVYFAYFPPYSYERHLDLISKCAAAPKATVESLGQSLDGREMECVKVGNGSMICWIIHRQHPGETMAEYYAEGLLSRLLGLDSGFSVDGMVADALKMYTFYIVPNMVSICQ